MKKILIALGLSLALVGVMAVPAMAASPSKSGNPRPVSTTVNIMTLDTDGTSIYIAYPNPNNGDLDVTVSNNSSLGFDAPYFILPPNDLSINFSSGNATLVGTVPNTSYTVNMTWTFSASDVVLSHEAHDTQTESISAPPSSISFSSTGSGTDVTGAYGGTVSVPTTTTSVDLSAGSITTVTSPELSHGRPE